MTHPSGPRRDTDDLLRQSFQRMSMAAFSPPSPRAHATPLERTAKKLKDLNLKPVDVVADFLTSVRELAIKTISESYNKEFVAHSKVVFILTIPAIWTDQAKALVVQAAKTAQLGTHRVDFHLCSEPEAAAAHAFRVIQPHNPSVGESIVVCDAGGGTCDLVSYEIGSVNPLKLNEAVSGTGDLCGSVYLDQGFNRYIRRLLGDARIEKMKPRARQQMERSFERVKIRFGNATDRYFEVNVPGIPDDEVLNIEDGFHSMSASDLKGIFDPVVNRIIELVRQQVTSLQRQGKKISAILLVGGFGSSAYLKSQLENTVYGRGQRIQVIQPINARTAIARGALIRGLDGSIVHEKRSRRHYGISAAAPYEHGKGQDSQMYWHPANDAFYVAGKMFWYLKKEAVVGDNESVTISFERTKVCNGFNATRDLMFQDTLLACDLDSPPDFKWETNSVCRVCTVYSDLTKIPTSEFIKFSNCSGQSFFRISFDLKLSIIDDVMQLELLFAGKPQGKVTTKFE